MNQSLATIDAGISAARLRIGLTYWWRHRRLPRLDDPILFTELVQRRKLRDRDGRMAMLADKVEVKSFVAAHLGDEWVIPTLWSGERLPGLCPASLPVVVKARHGCNQNVFVREDRDWAIACRASRRWMKNPYGEWLDEWLYAEIPRGLLMEPLIQPGPALPIDYKLYVFGGRVTHVQVHLDRASRHRWVMHDADWRPLAAGAPDIPRPSALSAMVAAAETLAADFDFVRIDFYQPAEQPLFGEISFYPGSGLDAFDPPQLDAELGALWRQASAGPEQDFGDRARTATAGRTPPRTP